ncbi:uncharacterized mitochondrial protein AtMg00860-like [Thunnus albacares]|uniref:uncharacterized mitochondrial protein AtMg00860-like n=1 Tax=Thunnus albacares TaxID=8236 RepID=UPI001CF6DD73|nr:uncharacterized mitochondrial protein AtMg00860-like [Thunnus albacares]
MHTPPYDLCDMINRFVFVYLDDILIFSLTQLEHKQHVRQVLQHLLENKLYVKAERFHVSSVSFLGYIIEQGQVLMDPAKVTAVTEWPKPTNLKQLQRFPSFANFYRRFIKDYGHIAAPLTALNSTSTIFMWSPEAEATFKDLKSCFASAPILIQPDPVRQFVVEVDAFDTRVGAVLSQQSSIDNFIYVPFSPASCHLLKEIMTSVTGIFLLSNWI